MSAIRATLALIVCGTLSSSLVRGNEHLLAVHVQRYAMGTTFEIVAYHASRSDAERTVEKAMAEIVRLDGVMSHFKADSDLSRLVREARSSFVSVDPRLYDVIEQSLAFSQRSGGKFDITIGPLVKIWKRAHAQGRTPSDSEIAGARQCVGHERIEMRAPDQIRLHSDCVELDLGGIGKGYAVDRAMDLLATAGIRHALINAGGSSIAAIGAPPGKTAWPVNIGASGSRTVMLRNGSISTSQQNLVGLSFAHGSFGDIVDPVTGAPVSSTTSVSVIASTATIADVLSTTLVTMSREDGTKLLPKFSDVSAIWMSQAGELLGSFRDSQLRFADSP